MNCSILCNLLLVIANKKAGILFRTFLVGWYEIITIIAVANAPITELNFLEGVCVQINVKTKTKRFHTKIFIRNVCNWYEQQYV